MEHVRAFLQEEDGVGVVEIILILVEIFTQYYRMGIWCITQKYVDK